MGYPLVLTKKCSSAKIVDRCSMFDMFDMVDKGARFFCTILKSGKGGLK